MCGGAEARGSEGEKKKGGESGERTVKSASTLSSAGVPRISYRERRGVVRRGADERRGREHDERGSGEESDDLKKAVIMLLREASQQQHRRPIVIVRIARRGRHCYDNNTRRSSNSSSVSASAISNADGRDFDLVVVVVAPPALSGTNLKA